mmetsp:Transcript_36441/g.96121  ORF Transcript_36441/g.96121 Transcript_36441/m.96121 type:complete len:208 (-) Transcript_36441:472-1095(-)
MVGRPSKTPLCDPLQERRSGRVHSLTASRCTGFNRIDAAGLGGSSSRPVCGLGLGPCVQHASLLPLLLPIAATWRWPVRGFLSGTNFASELPALKLVAPTGRKERLIVQGLHLLNLRQHYIWSKEGKHHLHIGLVARPLPDDLIVCMIQMFARRNQPLVGRLQVRLQRRLRILALCIYGSLWVPVQTMCCGTATAEEGAPVHEKCES